MNFRALLHALFALLIFGANARAHPVAQGSLDVDVRPGRIELRVRVSNEEVFIAGTLGNGADPGATLEDLFSAHGRYLIGHLRVAADGKPLAGRVERVLPPSDKTLSGYSTYELRYEAAVVPGAVSIGQDVLNEIEFAPGNPWESTYIVRQLLEGHPIREALLLTRHEPLLLDCQARGGSALDRRMLAWSYLWHGVNHILGGWDHLLFMAALVLAVAGFRDLVKVIAAFTLAHTLTLTLCVLGVVRLPSHIVEPIIAISIVFVAVENVVWPKRIQGKGRLAVAFGFGLFHGMGFAGGLLEAMQGLGGGAVFIALAAFSLGVELGHQAVVLPVFIAMKALRGSQQRHQPRTVVIRYGSCAIAVAGIFYFLNAVRA